MTAALNAPGVALTAESLIALRQKAVTTEDPTPPAALPGGFVTKKRGHGQEVADVREYVSGDDIRHLDRGSTARTGTLHVRSFQEERDRITMLVADFRPAMLWGARRAFRSVAAAEALALIGWRVVEQGGRVGLLAIGAGEPVAVSVRGRARGMLAVIGGLVRAHEAALHLALAGQRDDPPLDDALARVGRVAPVGSEVVIASGFDATGPDLDECFGQLARRRVLRPILVVDIVTENLPPGVYPIRLPDGARRRARVTARSRAVRDAADVAGRPALRLDAGQPVQDTARILQAAFPPDREP